MGIKEVIEALAASTSLPSRLKQVAQKKARVLQFLEADVLDRERLREILRRHGLTGDWQQFERQFLEEK